MFALIQFWRDNRQYDFSKDVCSKNVDCCFLCAPTFGYACLSLSIVIAGCVQLICGYDAGFSIGA